jgi:ADP-L-glycero-D-manno-heptose 6-epimerase
MNILVTGNNGFIGFNMVERLKSKGHNISTFEWGETLPKVQGLDWVIHLGAISNTTETDVDKVLYQNLDFSIWLMHECEQNKVNIQYASSASVYGLGKEFKEDSPVDPRTPYSYSKYLFERFVRSNNWNIIHQGFRYFNVFGPHEEHKGSQASPHTQFKIQAENNNLIKVFENSENYHRDFIHVYDVLDFHEKFFEVNESGIWNVGTGNTRSFLDVAKNFNVPIETIPMPENLKHSYQTYTCADLEKVRNTLQQYHKESTSNV